MFDRFYGIQFTSFNSNTDTNWLRVLTDPVEVTIAIIVTKW